MLFYLEIWFIILEAFYCKGIHQIEIYDQIWFVRSRTKHISGHSAEAVALVRQFVAELEDIPDGCSELFPFDLIKRLRDEFKI